MKNFNVDNLLHSVLSEIDILDIKTLFEDKLKEYNLSKTRALQILNIDKDVFDEIISGTAKQPSLINVIKLAEFIEIEIDDIVKAVIKNQNSENLNSIEKARNVTFLVKNFDVKVLTKLGFFENTPDINILIKRVLTFFGFDSILEFEQTLNAPLFSKTKRNFSDKMKDFWIKSAYQSFKIINNPNQYDRDRLKDLIVKIKPYSQDVTSGLFTVCKALYNVGVTVIFQDYLSTTQIRGATFIIEGKPCIVLTDYRKIYPTLWFTLLHELHHVLFDFDKVETNNFHLSGDNDLFLIEEKADSFARDFFLSEEKFSFIKKLINNNYIVSKYARELEVHESIIYAWYSWYQDKLYNKNYYGAFKEHYPDYLIALSKLNPLQWSDESIKEVSLKIKSIFELNLKA